VLALQPNDIDEQITSRVRLDSVRRGVPSKLQFNCKPVKKRFTKKFMQSNVRAAIYRITCNAKNKNAKGSAFKQALLYNAAM
jgi:hypothetical protein